MKIVYMGTPEFAVPTLKALHGSGFEISLVVTQPDRQAGRGKKEKPTAVKTAAIELGLQVYQPENVNIDESIEKIASAEPDFIAVVAFGQILKKNLLNLPKTACVNLHGSLLPLLRGAAPIHRSIMEGLAETGITTMMMARRMDAGDMLLKETLPIEPETTTGDLHDSLAEMGGPLMAKTLKLLASDEITPQPQDEGEATYAPKLEPAEREIDWSLDAVTIDRKIRGLAPSPGAYTWFRGKRVILLGSRLVEGGRPLGAPGIRGAPGTLNISDSNRLEVTAQSGRLSIPEIRQEGKKAMPGIDWANGARLEEGETFTSGQ
jgi:methionyl-tRNA formyltransferase